MSIETLISDLISAINANTEALKSAPKAEKPAAAPKAEKPAAPAPAPVEEKKPEPPKQKSGDEVTAALNKLKEKFGAEPAKTIIKNCGFAKLAELLTDGTKNTLAYDMATSKFEELSKEAEDGM